MKRLLLCSLLNLLCGSFLITFAQSEPREKPRLIDFGSSLRPGYNKPKISASENQKTGEADDGEIVRIDTNLVVSDVLVLNEKGVSVNNLTKEDFVITEDGVEQTTETFAQGSDGKVGRSIVLVMDYSLSLRPYIKTSVAAAKVLIDQLNPKDRMAIVTDDVELIADFTRDKNLLKTKLDALESRAEDKKIGRSRQFSALLAALNELFDVEDVRPIVIFQTDGDEYFYLKNNSRLRPPGAENLVVSPLQRERNFTYQDVITATEKARATIYSVIPGRRFLERSPDEQLTQARHVFEERFRDDEAMRRRPPEEAEKLIRFYAQYFPITHKSVASVAMSSGGWADSLEIPEEADGIYAKILTDINNRYLVGYYPINQTRDGKRRTLKIQVRNHPEYQIFTRRSYYAPVDP